MRARLDQHFLKSPEVRDRVVAAAALSRGERVIEIGPGRGILTRALLAAGAEVLAIEKDDRLAPELSRELSGDKRFKLIHADFLEIDPAALGPGPLKIVANLPYSVATPILQRFLPWPFWTSAVLMFQKEVAQRITAGPGGGDYGLLTLSVLLRAEAEMLLDVPRECFVPRPKVGSAVVRLVRREKPLISSGREEAFWRVAKAAFGQRRKMAAGPISRGLKLPRESVVSAFRRCGLGPSCRAEEIPPEAWLRLPSELGL